VPCLEQVLTQAGCDQGALALALSNGATPSDYMATGRNLTSMTLYNKVATKPFNLSLYQQGQATVAAALQEAANVVAAATQPPTSALGASARDLCLQAGSINQYDFCSELLPTTPMSNVDPSCLQKAFLRAGGNENGTLYPSPTNTAALTYYSTLGTWGKFTQYLNTLNAYAKGAAQAEGFATKRKGTTGSRVAGNRYTKEGFVSMDDQVHQTYQLQSTALAQLRGITPDALLTNRVNPPSPGIDVYGIQYGGSSWIIVNQFVMASLTSEFVGTPNYFWGGPQNLQTITDLRVTTPTPYTLSLGGTPLYYATLNQPSWVNTPPLAASTSPVLSLSPSTPNVVRTVFQATSPSTVVTETTTAPATPTLVRESQRAPWIMLELDPAVGRSLFQNILYADLLQPAASSTGTVANGTTDMILKTPGKNGSIQLNGGAGTLKMPNFTFGVLKTLTMVFLTTGKSVQNALFTVTSATVNLTLTIGSDNQVAFSGTTPDGAVASTNTGIFVTPGTWYMMVASMPLDSPDWLFSIQTLSYAQQSTTNLANTVTNTFKFSTVTSPALVPIANQFRQVVLSVGDVAPNQTVSPTFQLNVAWIHLFSQAPTGPELVRDALNNWQITQPELP